VGLPHETTDYARLGVKGGLRSAKIYVRFTPESGHKMAIRDF
jgi:hypothetical protein